MKTKWQKNPRSEGIPFWPPLPAWFWAYNGQGEYVLTFSWNAEPSRWKYWTPMIFPIIAPEPPDDL